MHVGESTAATKSSFHLFLDHNNLFSVKFSLLIQNCMTHETEILDDLQLPNMKRHNCSKGFLKFYRL